MDSEDLEELRHEIAQLRARVESLERQQQGFRAVNPERSHREETVPGFTQAAKPSFVLPERPTLESRIGSQWLNRVGIVALLVGAAWFLKYAVDQRWLGPGARVAVGLACGLGLVAWSERFRRRGFPVFAFSLKAVAGGLLYLSLWAAFVLFHLITYPVAFAAMALVTAGNAWMCWVQESEVLAAFAAIGGFVTPMLLGSPEQTPDWILGSYLLLLNAGLLSLLRAKVWPRLLLAAFAGTVGYMVLMGFRDAAAGVAFSWNAVLFVLFSMASVWVAGLGATAIAVGTALANAAAGGLLLWLVPVGSRAVMPAVLAGWYGLLLALRRGGAEMAAVHAGLAGAFVAATLWQNLSGGWLVLGLTVEAMVLLLLSLREQMLGAEWLLRRPWPVAVLLAAAATELIWASLVGPLADSAGAARIALYLLLAGVSAGAVRVAAKHDAMARRRGEHADAWVGMGRGAALLATGLLLLGGVLQIHTSAGGSFYVSAWAAVLGAGLLLVGFRVRWPFLRWTALGLLTLAIAKVFLFDTRSLSQGYRILSFLGLGVLLLAVSFVYQRDLLKLRGEEHDG
jgi:uncharacterized membrane protein